MGTGVQGSRAAVIGVVGLLGLALGAGLGWGSAHLAPPGQERPLCGVYNKPGPLWVFHVSGGPAYGGHGVTLWLYGQQPVAVAIWEERNGANALDRALKIEQTTTIRTEQELEALINSYRWDWSDGHP